MLLHRFYHSMSDSFAFCRCGLVSLWMAGQYLCPDNAHDVCDIYEKAQELNYTRHGEMFSALNMAKLANELFECKAHNEKGSYKTLNNLEKMLEFIVRDEKLILVPYDSGADQWPQMAKGDKAHWGVIFGVALMMPFKNKVFDQAEHLDGYLSYVKPPLSQETIDEILKVSEIPSLQFWGFDLSTSMYRF